MNTKKQAIRKLTFPVRKLIEEKLTRDLHRRLQLQTKSSVSAELVLRHLEGAWCFLALLLSMAESYLGPVYAKLPPEGHRAAQEQSRNCAAA
jgi:hypothetical protein